HNVLDAGCGVCGPSIDIAQGLGPVHIDAVTLSPVQAALAREAVEQVGLGGHIRVYACDYHSLPFKDATFDVVFFFESMMYSCDLPRLLAEIHRVLRRGGRLYAKEILRLPHLLSEGEQRALHEFEDVFQYRVRPVAEIVACASATGFEQIETADLSS